MERLDRRRGLWALKGLGEAPLPLFAAAEYIVDGIQNSPHPEEREKLISRGRKRMRKSEIAASLLPECRSASMSSRITRPWG